MYSVGVSTVTLTYGSWIARDLVRVGHRRRVVDHLHAAVDEIDPVLHVGRGCDEREVVLALEPLAHDLHVQQPEKPAPEPEPERARRLRLVGERRVVQPQLLERFTELGVLVAVDGIEAAEHHRLRVAVALERGRRTRRGGDRLTDARTADVLDAGDEVADLAGSETGDGCGYRLAHADLLRVVHRVRLDEAQPARR